MKHLRLTKMLYKCKFLVRNSTANSAENELKYDLKNRNNFLNVLITISKFWIVITISFQHVHEIMLNKSQIFTSLPIT